jgi:hypothetical protein
VGYLIYVIYEKFGNSEEWNELVSFRTPEEYEWWMARFGGVSGKTLSRMKVKKEVVSSARYLRSM